MIFGNATGLLRNAKPDWSRQTVLSAAATAAMISALTGVPLANADAAGAGSTDVAAKYRLSFNGFDVGSYAFKSQFNDATYSASSSADVSALFGAFKWRGSIETSGAMQASKPRPSSYLMTYKTKKKTGSVRLSFLNGDVKAVAVVPAKPPGPEVVPVTANHYKSVFDPLSAILALTAGAGKKPCDQRVPIFDGKARFDLALSFKAKERVADKEPSGQPRELIVCRIKYLPIAGHKPKDFVNPWVDYGDIEIAFRPIPTAGVHVPYRIAIPTTLGTAQMLAESVTITAPDRSEIALRQ